MKIAIIIAGLLAGALYYVGWDTDAAIIFLKCGGIGGEQNFNQCSWRETSVFAVMLRRTQKPQNVVAPVVHHSKCESRLYRSLHRSKCLLVFFPNADGTIRSIEWRSTDELGISEPKKAGRQSRASRIAGTIRELIVPCSEKHPCKVQP